MPKVVVAMSGGGGSSVAATILKEEGYDVIGATLELWPSDKLAREAENFGSCCSQSAIENARRVACRLGIPHRVINLREIFAQKVIAHFCREYSSGRTPNPCIKCNRCIKFGALLERAREFDADFVATGHYARIDKNMANGRFLLKRGIDPTKDQSYVLYALTQDQLEHTIFPLGNLTKERVWEIAQGLGSAIASKSESQDICFIPDGDRPGFLKEYVPQAAEPGPILDREGTILGAHRGIMFYTIGQRKRLGISAKEPLYVTEIDQERNAIVVGPKREVYEDELIASELNWIAMEELRRAIRAKAKIRYLHQESEATVMPVTGDKVRVKFKQPQMAIAPGQAVVFYDGDVVVGGGTIDQTGKMATWPK